MQPEEILTALDILSGGRLQCREDLAFLLEATPGDRRALLDDLSFQAKFAVRSRTIMERIGRDGEGYDRLAAEFGAALTRIQELLRRILEETAPDRRSALTTRYLGMTPHSLAALLALCGDLDWYKNWLNDRRSAAG